MAGPFMVKVLIKGDEGYTSDFGPFRVECDAEECVTVLAARDDVLSAEIKDIGPKTEDD